MVKIINLTITYTHIQKTVNPKSVHSDHRVGTKLSTASILIFT